ncbi:iron-containing redox enzyme family protein [Brachybacterium vulturis]|uniref:iron-containing redox enzyme family protein n=1 Tax=Brachybacterium vulturis TaxID=2017484 RepID=UPI0037364005
MRIPTARGPLSEAVLRILRSGDTDGASSLPAAGSIDDAQIALWSLYELHYRGFGGVSDSLEWDPQLIGLRRRLERDFEHELRERAPLPPPPGDFAEDFFAAIAAHDGPSVAHYLQRSATETQMHEFLRHKSIYTLKESDHTTWTIPRLSYPVKAAVVELQYDEYGGGNPHRLHANLFAKGIEACGLSAEYGAYIDDAPVEVLVQNNVMSLFGLNRRLRAASLGFLGAFEATSSGPCRRIARGLARLGFPAEIIEYYTEHVEADAVHEQLAVRTVCGVLLEEEPEQYENIWFGAWACMYVDDLYADRALGEWAS